MDQGYELRLADIRKDPFEEVQNTDLYIPLYGKYTTNSDEEPFDLAEKINSFFEFDDSSNYDPKVMLLMGDTGSGKSVFSQQLHQQQWRAYKTGDPIPLWIPLPELQNPFEGAVEEVLTTCGFSEAQISKIKEKEKFIFIVDGYDELHQFQNFYVTNRWNQWSAKVLITCRSQALYYQKDPDKYFMPFNGEKRLPMLLRKLYVAGFSKEQISAYVKQYQKLNTENKISEEDFTKVLGLTELINTPFLLHLVVEALPDILAAQADDLKMTQAKLYDVFIERWFTRQVKKLSAAGLLTDSEEFTKQQFWNYCKKLAKKMHAKEVSVIPYQGQKVGGRLFEKQDRSTIWDSFFNEETEVLRSACPLKRFGNHNYGFVHVSLGEYFATRAMYEEIQEDAFTSHDTINASEARQSSEMIGLSGSLRVARDEGHRILHGGIHQRIFSLETQSIRFLADRIQMNEDFKQKMLVMLEASKKSKRFAIGSANAITALVKAGVTFNGKNLSGVNISGANLTGGSFHRANFSNAILTDVNLIRTYLSYADFSNADLANINFGRDPIVALKNYITAFDISSDRNLMSIGLKTEDDLFHWIEIWDIEQRKMTKRFFGHTTKISCVCFSPDNTRMLSAGDDKIIIQWSIETGLILTQSKGHIGDISCVSYSKNQTRFASSSFDKTVRQWNASTGEWLTTSHGHQRVVTCVTYSPDGEYLASGGFDNNVRLWLASTGVEKLVFKGHTDFVWCVNYLADNKRLVSGSSDNTIIQWSCENGAIIKRLTGHTSGIACMSADETGQRLLSGSSDETVRLWDLNTGQMLCNYQGSGEWIKHLKYMAGNKKFIACGDNKIFQWNNSEVDNLVQEVGHKDVINSLGLSSDGQYLISGSSDKSLKLWSAQSGKELRTFTGIMGPVFSVAFNTRDDHFLSGSLEYYQGVYEWKLDNSHSVAHWKDHNKGVTCVIYNTEGTLWASASYDGTIRIISAESGKTIKIIQVKSGWIFSISFSPDGSAISAGCKLEKNISLRQWHIASGEEISAINTGKDVDCLVYSSNGKYLLSGGFIGVDLWVIESTGKLNHFSNFPFQAVRCVAFSHDSQLFFFGNDEGYIYVWDITTLEVVDIIHDMGSVKTIAINQQNDIFSAGDNFGIRRWHCHSEGKQKSWALNWSTHTSTSLILFGAKLKDSLHLSLDNKLLCHQLGVINYSATELSFPKLIVLQKKLMQLSGPNDSEEAMQICEKILSYNSNNIDVLIKKAELYMELDDYLQSLKILIAILRVDKTHRKALDMFGVVKIQQGEIYEAEENYQQAIECYSDAIKVALDPHILIIALQAKGELLYNASQYKEAINCFENILAINPKDDESLEMLRDCKSKISEPLVVLVGRRTSSPLHQNDGESPDYTSNNTFNYK